jgi:hypothetical protein
MSSSGAAVGAAPFVLVRRAVAGARDFADDSFVAVPTAGVPTVAFLALRIRDDFPHWRIEPERVRFYFAAPSSAAAPASAAIDAAVVDEARRLGEGAPLAAIGSGAWILARVMPPAAWPDGAGAGVPAGADLGAAAGVCTGVGAGAAESTRARAPATPDRGDSSDDDDAADCGDAARGASAARERFARKLARAAAGALHWQASSEVGAPAGSA